MENKELSSVNHYTTPVFSTWNKVKRVLWQLTWAIFCKWTPPPFFLWRNFIIRFFGAKIGKKVNIYPTCKIWAPWLLTMEDSSCIGPGAEVYNPDGCFIGKWAIVSQDAYLCGATHDFNSENFTYIKKRIVIEDYVWICAKAVVLPGVKCQEGAVLGAAAVASKDLESWSVYAGSPAKFIKKRTNFITKE